MNFLLHIFYIMHINKIDGNFSKVLDAFKKSPKSNFYKVEATSGKTALHEVFLRDSAKHQDGREPGRGDASYAKCVKVLLGKPYSSNRKFETEVSRVINYQDSLEGNTALHLATMQADQEIIKALLRRGANMGVKNFRSVILRN